MKHERTDNTDKLLMQQTLDCWQCDTK